MFDVQYCAKDAQPETKRKTWVHAKRVETIGEGEAHIRGHNRAFLHIFGKEAALTYRVVRVQDVLLSSH